MKDFVNAMAHNACVVSHLKFKFGAEKMWLKIWMTLRSKLMSANIAGKNPFEIAYPVSGAYNT